MKKNLLLAILGGGAMLFSASSAKAQETVVVENSVVTEVPVDCKTMYNTTWKDNWFIQLGAGVQIPYVDRYLDNGNSKRHITTVYNLGFGRWFSPYLGLRISGYYGRLHLDWGKYNKADMANVNADLMWDMLNSICGPKADRTLSILPYVGIGGTYTWNFDPTLASIPDGSGHLKTKEWTLPVSTGIQLRFRLSQYIDFFAEGRVNFYGDNFNNVVSGSPIEANVSAYGGFIYNIGGRKYNAYNPCEYLGYINSLNGQVNELRGALATTTAALAAAEAQLPCPEVVAAEEIIIETPILASVRFKINSAVINEDEMVNVYNVAEWMKANPDRKVIVQGYADKDTGTSEYNMELSQRRGQSVVDALVNFGVAPERLTIQANGSDVQPYDTNDWNRIVIFSEP